jgi:3-hydroxyisobutyrate dehydrogenase-like beta-hydroxyacid dehydrogenase
MPDAIGFLWLGNLGRPIVSNLMAAGYQLTIYNRDANKVATRTRRVSVLT